MILRPNVCVLALLAVSGCTQPTTAPQAEAPGPCNIAEYRGLRACLTANRDEVVVGEPFTLALEVVNETDQPMTIDATSAAKAVAAVWAYRDRQWRRLYEYPEASAAVMQSWTLPAGGSETFYLTLYAQPDWPTLEQLKVTAELNGRADVRPFVWLTVLPNESP